MARHNGRAAFDDDADASARRCQQRPRCSAPAVPFPLARRCLARYLSSGWNLIDIVCLSLMLYLTIAWLATGYDAPDVRVAAVTGLLAYVKLLGFLRMFRSLAAFVALLSEVAKDSVPFATILLTVIVGFGTAFNMLGIFDGLASPARGNTLASSVYGTFMFALGELFLDDNLFSSDFHKVLQSLCAVLVLIVMMNLLIAVISDSFERAQEKEESQFQYELAHLIRDNNAVLDMLEALGYAKEEPCRWLHVLEPKEDTAGAGQSAVVRKGIRQHSRRTAAELKGAFKADMEKLQEKLSKKLKAELKASNDELKASNEKLEADMAELKHKLDSIVALMHSSRASTQ